MGPCAGVTLQQLLRYFQGLLWYTFLRIIVITYKYYIVSYQRIACVRRLKLTKTYIDEIIFVEM